MKIRYAIIEDEIYARQSLERKIQMQRPEYEKLFEANSVKEAIGLLQQFKELDLIFMDVELSDGICFEIFEAVNVVCPIIFTTAYDDYAIKAFKVNSMDYLLKPIVDADLALALSKFERFTSAHGTSNSLIESGHDTDIKGHDEIETKRILLINGDRFNWADITDVRLIESEDDYIYVTLRNGKRSMAAQRSLSKTLSMLPSDIFFQIDRSTIVSIEAIASVSKYFKGRLMVKIALQDEIRTYIVSSARRDSILKWLGK